MRHAHRTPRAPEVAAQRRHGARPSPDRGLADAAAIRRRLEEIDAIYRTAPVALGAVGPDFRWMRVNERMAALDGVPVDDHPGRRVDEVPAGLGAEIQECCARVLTSGVPEVEQQVAGRIPGAERERTWRVSCFPIGDAGDPAGVNVFVRDVTEVLVVQRLRDTFIGILSHELRTPATSIYTAGVLLRRIATDERVAGLAGDIAAEADHLVRILENLLVLARVERGASVVDASEPLLVQHVLRREAAAERARHPDTSVELAVAADLPPVVGDAERIGLVVRNLLSNAAKYGRRGGITLVAAGLAPDGGVLVRVIDDGPGLDDPDPDRLFDLYYRSPAAAARLPGAGIGLFVCRAVIEATGGRIGARPGPERGAEFWFEVPRFADDEAEVALAPPDRDR